ncbi:UDP-glycosyltransferase 79B3 [Sesbania bispinosa]|nr:UDP-glycosyltransferase 79B3 [Sesbania bispinosa]
MDLTEKDIELLLSELKPHFVFFDFQHWIPSLARSLGIKSVQYFIVNPASTATLDQPKKSQGENQLKLILWSHLRGSLVHPSSFTHMNFDPLLPQANWSLEVVFCLYDRFGTALSPLLDLVYEEALPEGFRERVQGRGIAMEVGCNNN